MFVPTFALAVTSRTSAYTCTYHTTRLARFPRATTYSSHSMQLLANVIKKTTLHAWHFDYMEMFVFNDHPMCVCISLGGYLFFCLTQFTIPSSLALRLVPDWISCGWECFWLNFQVCNTDNSRRKYTTMYTVLTCWFESGFIVHSYTRAQLQKLWCYKGLCWLDHIMHVRSIIHKSTVTMSFCSRFYGNQCHKICCNLWYIAVVCRQNTK